MVVGAAPHLPAGILSPGRGALSLMVSPIANVAGRSVELAAGPLRPVTIRGEGAGRRMRGGADFRELPSHSMLP
ncbi:hypothetical protein EN780_03935 [Mesorhizobium sp. M4B.F.Ca.ET.089.01.1.1]|nr:hypothetical protein EN780_03935 [Mesorhizobium sp. M4B.F.Ca.ET.089.01.1.1]